MDSMQSSPNSGFGNYTLRIVLWLIRHRPASRSPTANSIDVRFATLHFENVHFLDCNFPIVDLCDVVIRNSLIANTTIRETQMEKSTLESITWCYNSFNRCILEGFRPDKPNWTYTIYRDIIVAYNDDAKKSDNWIRKSSILTY